MPPKAISTKPYADIGRAGKPGAQRRLILFHFKLGQQPLNRRMLAVVTRIPLSSICWRVKGMIESGLLEVVSEAKDPATGQDTEFLFPTPGEVKQMTFSFPEKGIVMSEAVGITEMMEENGRTFLRSVKKQPPDPTSKRWR